MNFNQFICYILIILASLWLGQNYITSFSAGKRLFDLFESGIINVANWRANADVKRDIYVVKKFFTIVWFTSFGVTLIFSLVFSPWLKDKISSDIILFLLGVFLVSGIIWVSLDFTFTPKKYIKWYVYLPALNIFGLIFFPFLEGNGYSNSQYLDNINNVFVQPFGLEASYPWQIILFSSLIIIGLFAIWYVSTWLMCILISFSIVSLLYLTNKLALFTVTRSNRKIVNTIVFLIYISAIIVQPWL